MIKLLQGILIGIGVGILIAPDKGSETRRKLLNRVNNLKDDGEYYLLEAADQVKSKAKTIASSAKSKAKDIVDNVKAKANDLKGDVEEA